MNYDTFGFFNNFMSDNPSVIGRTGNLISSAITTKVDKRLVPFPKFIVVVLDADILKNFTASGGVSKSITRMLNYVMTEHECAIAAYKEHLPAKCLKPDQTQILWIHAPLHDNFSDWDNSLRVRFNKCLDEVSKLHTNVTALPFKKVWNPQDDDLFLQYSYRFTASGLKAYWEAIDRTVRYFDSIVLKKQFKKKQGNGHANFNQQRIHSVGSQKGFIGQKDQKSLSERFRWQNPDYNRSFKSPVVFKKLPMPLPRH